MCLLIIGTGPTWKHSKAESWASSLSYQRSLEGVQDCVLLIDFWMILVGAKQMKSSGAVDPICD